ncbi:MAG: DUF4384 domain-containing protein [Bacteroides sp.]|nr:DUF4384 domain-containing protein [Bacteroides sp.]
MKLKFCIQLFVALMSVAVGSTAYADNIKTVSGDYTFYGESNHSLEQCKRLALEGARIAALKAAYGTTISNDIYSRESNDGDGYFSSLSASEVKGEWIADDGEPKYEISIDSDGHYIVQCRVRGRAREIGNEAVAFEAVTLRGSDDLSARTTSFVNGDELRLFFRSPIEGYVAVFLIDDSKTAWRLLPYSGDGKGEVHARHGKEYVFFSSNSGDGISDSALVDELVLNTDKESERNEICVVFSPKSFSIPGVQTSNDLPPSLSLDAFNRWLSDSRRRDSKMGVKRIGIEIREQ